MAHALRGGAVMPAVSVILPVRDAMPYLPETLQTLASQTLEDFEVLLQDDGSADDSTDCRADVSRRDPRFRLETREARGVVAAVNRAHARARAPLHVRIDADDLARPERLARQVAFAEAHPEVGYFGSLVEFFPRASMGDGLRHYGAWNNACVAHEAIHADRFVELPIANPSVAMRAEVFHALGGYGAGPFPEDYDFFLRCAARGVRFGKVPEVLVDWRDHPGRATHTDPRYALEAFFELKVRHITPFLAARGHPLVVAGAGRDGKRWARRLRDVGLPVRGFLEVHPGRIGQSIAGLPVEGYADLPALDPCTVLAAVGRRGARADVRAHLAAAGRMEDEDFICVQ
jgi:hypothetical protein